MYPEALALRESGFQSKAIAQHILQAFMRFRFADMMDDGALGQSRPVRNPDRIVLQITPMLVWPLLVPGVYSDSERVVNSMVLASVLLHELAVSNYHHHRSDVHAFLIQRGVALCESRRSNYDFGPRLASRRTSSPTGYRGRRSAVSHRSIAATAGTAGSPASTRKQDDRCWAHEDSYVECELFVRTSAIPSLSLKEHVSIDSTELLLPCSISHH